MLRAVYNVCGMCAKIIRCYVPLRYSSLLPAVKIDIPAYERYASATLGKGGS